MSIDHQGMIGDYGGWTAGIAPDPPTLSLRRDGWKDVDEWRASARERLAVPKTSHAEANTFLTREPRPGWEL